jgi:hypothetical protein
MKLRAKVVPYSSIVGGGVTLLDEKGAARFILSLRGTTQGIDRQQTEALTKQIADLINANGLRALESQEQDGG